MASKRSSSSSMSSRSTSCNWPLDSSHLQSHRRSNCELELKYRRLEEMAIDYVTYLSVASIVTPERNFECAWRTVREFFELWMRSEEVRGSTYIGRETRRRCSLKLRRESICKRLAFPRFYFSIYAIFIYFILIHIYFMFK